MGTRLVFLGPPGAGKGTQAVLASRALGVPVVTGGALLREAISRDTAMGRQVAQFVNAGLAVPDKLNHAVAVERLKERDCRKGFILDGYPRNLVQAKSLDTYLQRGHRPLEHVLFFKVEAAAVVGRLTQRRICSQCGTTYNLDQRPTPPEDRCRRCGGALVMRSDDQPDAIRKRLEAFAEAAAPLVEYYGKRGVLSLIDAEQPEAAVAQQVAAHGRPKD